MNYLKLSVEKKIAIFFLLVIIILSIIFFAINRSNAHFNDTLQKTEHINQVLLQKDRILSNARDIETSTMRYIITGNETSLQTFYSAVPTLKTSINEFRKLSGSSSAQQVNIDLVEKSVNKNIELRKQIIDIRKQKGIEQASQVFATGITREAMDELRNLLSKIEKEENLELSRNKVQNKNAIHSLFTLISLFRFVIIFLLIIAFVVIYRNIRRRNKAEEKIKKLNEELESRVVEKTKEILEKEAQYRFLLENMREGIQVIGFDWRYRFINQSAANQGKATGEELVGHTMQEKYPGIENTVLFQTLQRCMNERTAAIIENKFSYPDNSEAWFELSIQPVPEGLFILSMDITERKKSELLLIQLNTELEKKAAELQNTNTELERFVYVASHDLQEPLRMVGSFLHLLEEELKESLNEIQKQYIYFATDGAERMKRLIQDLLKYSRVNSGNEGFENVDCNKLLSEVVTIFNIRIQKTKARIHIKPLPVISAVPSQMQQVFQNLVSNALKYNNSIPEIEVGCNNKNSQWEFYVKDNGIGIDPKYYDKIFIIFQRLHNKSEYSGTGIGLAICKKIINNHGGGIWVQSEPGKGSTFFFTIPKHEL